MTAEQACALIEMATALPSLLSADCALDKQPPRTARGIRQQDLKDLEVTEPLPEVFLDSPFMLAEFVLASFGCRRPELPVVFALAFVELLPVLLLEASTTRRCPKCYLAEVSDSAGGVVATITPARGAVAIDPDHK